MKAFGGEGKIRGRELQHLYCLKTWDKHVGEWDGDDPSLVPRLQEKNKNGKMEAWSLYKQVLSLLDLVSKTKFCFKMHKRAVKLKQNNSGFVSN